MPFLRNSQYRNNENTLLKIVSVIFNSLRIFYGLIWTKSRKLYMWLKYLQDKKNNKITQKKDENAIN